MRKGDTILTVNGIDMSDPSMGIQALAEVPTWLPTTPAQPSLPALPLTAYNSSSPPTIALAALREALGCGRGRSAAGKSA